MSAVTSENLAAVSLFSNCGAGDVGFARAGFDFKVIAELDEARIGVASLNHPKASAVSGDLRVTFPQVVADFLTANPGRRPALLAACPPCQGMSSARSGRGKEADASAGSKDERNLLVDVVASTALELKPRMIVVENVWAFLSRKVEHPDTDEPISAARLLIERLGSEYSPFAFQCDLADYGVPQRRKRSFVVLIHTDEPCLAMLKEKKLAPFPKPSHGPGMQSPHVSITESLKSLAKGSLDARSHETAGSGLHAVPVWDETRYALIEAIKPGSGKGAWSNNRCGECGVVSIGQEDALCPKCGGPLLRPVVQDADGSWRLVRGFKTSSYFRMRPDEPAATITTASGSMGSDKTIHPSENRVLSPLECAHLQTFPKSFKWGDALTKLGQTNVRAMIGEAVPPQFTQLHGEILGALLAGKRPYRLISSDDPRVSGAQDRLNRD